MYCVKCGNRLEDRGKFCPRCGAKIDIAVTNGNKYENMQKCQKRGRKNVILKVFMGVVLVLAISGGTFGVLKFFDEKSKEDFKNVEIIKDSISGKNVEQYFACVQDENMKFGFIDKAGNEVIKCQYDVERDFSNFDNTLAAVGRKIGESDDGTVLYEWGFIDKTGEMVIPYQFDAVGPKVSENLVPVAKRENINGTVIYKWGFIDKTGRLIIPYEYSSFLWDYSSTVLDNKNLIGVQKKIDINGERVEKWGFINDKNETIIEFLYDVVTPFSKEGLAAAEKDGLCGYIDMNGEEVIPFKFLTAGTSGKDGKAIVSDENNQYGIIDKNGKILSYLENQEDNRGHLDDCFMENGLSRIWREAGDVYYVGLVDENGKEIVPCEYEYIRDPDVNGYMTVSKEQGDNILYGLMDSKGEMVIPLQYDKMSGFSENGWSVAGMRRSDSDKDVDRYYCKYINKDNQVIFKLPDKYINAWAFVRVN